MTSLFSILIITSVVNMGSIYSRNTTEITQTLNLEGFNQSINTIQDDAENRREQFEKQNIFSTVAGIIVTGIFDLAVAMISMIFAPFVIIFNVLTNVLHIPEIVTSTIMGLLTIAIIFGIWALIKIGK